MIYLDSASTRAVDPKVWEFIKPLMQEDFGNPSSTHELGQSARRALEYGRDLVSSVVGSGHDVTFTGGGTEANNLAIKGVALARWASESGAELGGAAGAAPDGRAGGSSGTLPGALPDGAYARRNVVISAIEHSSVVEAADYLGRFHGCEVRVAPTTPDGLIDLAALSRLLDEQTAVCAIGLANNEIGTIQDVATISSLCRRVGAHFHVDAVQAAGVLDVDLDRIGADSLSISGHKVAAPKGIGALISRAGVRLEPLIHGGGQERGVRSGTENVAFAVGLGFALSQAATRRLEVTECLTKYRDHLIDAVIRQVPGVTLTGHRTQRLPGHASFVFPAVAGETMLIELERTGVVASSGSACAAGRTEPSPVLLALGYAPEIAHTALRFSMDASISESSVATATRTIVSTLGSFIR